MEMNLNLTSSEADDHEFEAVEKKRKRKNRNHVGRSLAASLIMKQQRQLIFVKQVAAMFQRV